LIPPCQGQFEGGLSALAGHASLPEQDGLV
jgi:hypothetical protein